MHAPAAGPAPLRLALWQPEARVESPAERLSRLEAAIAGLPEPVDLVVTPELFLTGCDRGSAVAAAERSFGPSARAAAAMARRHRTGLILGYPEAAGDALHISGLCLGRGGETLGNARKRHLPSDGERATFRPGDEPCLFEIAGWRIGVAIGAETKLPELVRELARAGAALIAVPTALPRERAVTAREVVPACASENGVFVALANHAGREGGRDYRGESVVAAPSGAELGRGGPGEQMVRASLDPAALREIGER